MKIPHVFLACSLIFEICFAQYLDDEEVTNYLGIVENAVWEKVKDYGLSNLPDVDAKIRYDVIDVIDYDIKGDLYLEDGFVMDITSINITQEGPWNGNIVSNETATITSHLKFGLSFFRDFRFEADEPETIPDQTKGNVIIKPEAFYFGLSIQRNLIYQNVSSSVGNVLQGRTSRSGIEFHPNNTLTAILRKERYYGANIFPGLEPLWTPIFHSFLEEIIKTIEFPSIRYRTTEGSIARYN